MVLVRYLDLEDWQSCNGTATELRQVDQGPRKPRDDAGPDSQRGLGMIRCGASRDG